MAGTMTRDEFVTEICDIVGKKVSAASVSGTALQTRVRVYLNWAQRRLARAISCSELEVKKTDSATVANVKTYPLVTGTNNLGLTRPRDIRSIRLIDGANSRNLIKKSYRWFDKRFPRPENYSSGRSSFYIPEGSNIELFRIPDTVYTMEIRYNQWPTDFSTGSQTTDFDNKDELLVTAGVLETYLALEEYNDAQVWFNKFKGQVIDAQTDEEETDWEPEADSYSEHGEPIIGEPWISAEGNPGDPLYGYGG